MSEQSNEQKRRALREDRLVGVVMLVAGLAIAGAALHQTRAPGTMHAQTVPQTTPGTPIDAAPAESKPGGTRPTTPAPEPARPQNNDGSGQGTTTGTSPQMPPASSDRPPVTGTPLPPAPAEKTAPPIDRK